LSGSGLQSRRGDIAVVDESMARKAGLKVGDTFTVKTVQGTDEEFYNLRIVGITSPRQYFFQPAVLLPMITWDKIRPQASASISRGEVISNLIAIQMENPDNQAQISERIASQVDGVEVANKRQAILALPGYSAQQSTLNTQQGFTLLIGVLVVGGFFQIQTLQKVSQIGVLKAIGSPNRTVALASLLQIVLVTIIGVTIGSMGTLLLALGMPDGIPIVFSGPTVLAALGALLLIGPLGGLVSIRLAVKIDPLTAIGL
jgi:putative ABC transport system permease protein